LAYACFPAVKRDICRLKLDVIVRILFLFLLCSNKTLA